MSALISCTVRAAASRRRASAVETAPRADVTVASRAIAPNNAFCMGSPLAAAAASMIPGMPPRKKAVRRKKGAPASVGLSPAETQRVENAELDRLAAQVEQDGGAVIGRYSDPFGGTPLIVAALPVERVEPTPYQRDPS